MAQNSDTVFINGLYTYTNDKDYIVSKNSLNVEKFKQQLDDPDIQKHIKENEGYLKFITMISKGTGKPYSKLESNNYKEITSKEHSPDRNTNDDDGLPF